MTDITSFADNIKAGSGSSAMRVPSSGTSDLLGNGSIYKVDKESHENKKNTNIAADNEVARIDSARLNDGVFKPDVVESSSINPADYYRRGKIRPPQTNPEVSGDNVIGTQYDYNPRFLQDPENEELASIRLVGKATDNSRKDNIDLIPPFTKMFLESAQESHMERSQVVETFGDFYAFFFGERPVTYTFGGTLLNTKDINWRQDFQFYYDNFLRGTKAVEYKAKVIITYGLSQVEGFITGFSAQIMAANDKGVPVTFQMLVTKRRSMRLSIDFGIIEDNGRFNEDQSIINLITNGVSDPVVSEAYSKASKVTQITSPPSTSSPLKTGNMGSLQSVIPNGNFLASNGKVVLG